MDFLISTVPSSKLEACKFPSAKMQTSEFSLGLKLIFKGLFASRTKLLTPAQCGQIAVTTSVSSSGSKMGPPAEKE